MSKPSVRRGLFTVLSGAALPGAALLGAVAVGAVGCAHQVRIDSNVKDAEVRVDGVPVGTVKDGAFFTERAGLGTSYDIEVRARGHRTARRRLSPTIPEPWVGIPSMCSMIAGCTTATCAVPISLLVAGTSPDDPEVQCIGYGCATTSVAWAGGSAMVAAWGGERMPDVVTIDLERDDEIIGGADRTDAMAH